jgi:hypothetical protein
MSGEKQGWVKLGALGAFLAGVAAVATFYYTFIRARPQTFTVPVKPTSASSSPSSGIAAVFKREPGLDFEVKRCDVGRTLVSCILTVISPGYDRQLLLEPYNTFLADSDGDRFRMVGINQIIHLDRDQSIPLRMDFPVNKDITRPAHVQMSFYIDSNPVEKGFEVK